MKEIIGYIVVAFVCFALGALAIGFLASARTTKAEVRLRSADKIIYLAIKAISYLCLWDTVEFDELRKEIEKYEED